MIRTVLNVQQGTAAWLAERAKADGTASEYPAAAGKSKYQTRTALLQQRKTGLAKEVDAATQKLFDRGHATEALARPMAESIIGDELSPITVTLEIDGLTLLASVDGITFDDETAFEHKLWNESLAAQVRAEQLDEHYTCQLDQILLVTGAKRVLFMVSDGTEENCVWMWYYRDDAKFALLLVTWKQFKADLATFVPQEHKERVKADAVEAMPVPSIIVEGKLVACNLDEHIPTFDRFLADTKTELKTDDDFAQGEANAKTSREAAKALKQQAKAVIDQIAPVSQVVAIMEAYSTKFDALGLKLEKAVKEQKASIKTNAVLAAQQNWRKHIDALEVEIKPTRMNVTMPDFAEASKGVKTIAGLHSKIDDALAAGKAEANTQALELRAKLAWCKENADGYGFLFSDMQQIIFKPMDDFQLLVNSRVREHKDAEQKRIDEAARVLAEQQLEAQRQEEERKRIAAEELANSLKDQPVQQTEEPAAQDSTYVPAEPAGPADQAIYKRIADGYDTSRAGVQTRPEVAALPAANDVPDNGVLVKLGEIGALLGFNLPGDFIVTTLGFEPAERKGASMTFKATQVPLILIALSKHALEQSGKFVDELKKAA